MCKKNIFVRALAVFLAVALMWSVSCPPGFPIAAQASGTEESGEISGDSGTENETEPSEPVSPVVVTMNTVNCTVTTADGTKLSSSIELNEENTSITFVVVPASGCVLESVTAGAEVLAPNSEGCYTVTAEESVTVSAVCTDVTVPTMTAPTRTESGWAQAASYTFSAEDNIGIASAKLISADGAETEVVRNDDGTYTAKVIANGSYTIRVADAGGAFAEETISETQVDTSVPVIANWTRTAEGLVTAVDYTFTVEDSISGIDKVTLEVGNGEETDLIPGDDGVYTVTVKSSNAYTVSVYDMAGGKATQQIIDAEVDAEGPIIYNIVRSGNGWQNTQATYTFSVTDAVAGLGTVHFGAAGAELQPLTAGENGTYAVVISDNGSYTIRTTDALGNVTEQTITEAQIDKTAPTMEVPVRNESGWAAKAAYTVAPVDGESGIVSVTVRGESGPVMAVEPSPDGTYVIEVTNNGTYFIIARNGVGDIVQHEITETQIDTTAPKMSEIVRVHNEWTTEAEYSFSASDSQSGIGSVTVQIGDEAPVEIEETDGKYTFTVKTNAVFVVTVSDMVGNAVNSNGEETQVDITAPSISEIKRSESGWTTISTYTFTVEDAQSGLKEVTLKMGNADPVVLTATEAGVYGFLVHENTSFAITAVDVLGNSRTVTGAESQIDVSGPAVSDIVRQPEGWAKTATYSFVVTDDSGLKEIYVLVGDSRIEIAPANTGYTFQLNENTPFTICAVDNLANTATYEGVESMVDNEDPAITEVTRVDEGWAAAATYTFKATDSLSGVAEVTARIRNGDEQVLFPVDGVYSFTIAENAPFTLYVTDTVGNQNMIGRNEELVDTEAPDIFDVLRAGDAWEGGASYDFDVSDSQSGIALIEVYFENGRQTRVFEKVTGGYAFIASRNGTYTITVTDSVGNVTTETVVESLIDDEDPIISDFARQEKGWAISATYTFGVIDSQSGVQNVRLIIGDDVTFLEADDGIYSFTLTENCFFEILVLDNLGHRAYISDTESQIDYTAPVMAAPVRQESSWTYNATYLFTPEETQSGVASLVVTSKDGEAVTLSGDSDGVYTFKAKENTTYSATVTDGVGLAATITFEETQVDTAAPVVADITRDPDVWSQDSTYTFTVEDSLSGIQSVNVMLNEMEVAVVGKGNSTYSFNAVANGEYVITATDIVGNKTVIAVGETLIDITAPQILSIEPQDTWHPSENTVTIAVEDNAELVSVEVVNAEGTKQTVTQTEDGLYQTVVTANGTYTVTATDRAGNATTISFEVWHIDTDAPSQPVLTSSENELWVNTDVSLSAIATDSQSGVAAYWYSTESSTFDSATWRKMDFADGNGTLLLSAEQDSDYFVVAEDGVGRISTAASIHVSIDKTAPSELNASYLTGEDTGFNQIVNGIFVYNDKVTFLPTASDAASGVVKYEYRIENQYGESTEWYALEADEAGAPAVVRGVADELYTVYVRAYDLAGNLSAEFTCTVDGTPVRNVIENTPASDDMRSPAPNMSLATASGTYNGAWTNETVTVIASGSSAISGIAYYEYAVSYEDPAVLDIAWTIMPTSNGAGRIEIDKDTNAQYFFRAITYAGNYSQTTYCTVRVQKTAPNARTITEEAPTGTNGWYTKYPSYTVNQTEQNAFGAPVSYVITAYHNDELVSEYTFTEDNAPKIDADGSWKVTVTAVDEAGNRAAVEDSTASFRVDTKAPTGLSVTMDGEDILSVTKGSSNFQNVNILDRVQTTDFAIFRNSNVVVKASADGGDSGMAAIYYQAVATNGLYSPENSGKWKVLGADGIVLTPNNGYCLFFKAVDVAGNVTYFAGKSIVVDDRAPTALTLVPSTGNLSEHGFYSGNVTVDFLIADQASNLYTNYSGLQSVTYRVLRDGMETQSGQLYPSVTTTNSTLHGFVQRCSGSFTVDAQRNNSNNVIIEVTSTDQAGNTSTAYIQDGQVKIDVDNPTMSSSYNRNDVTATLGEDSIFTGNRTLTVIATERNFYAPGSFIRVTDTDSGRTETYEWTSSGNTHTAVIPVSQDGHYTVSATIMDTAGNTTTDMGFVAGTAAATTFVIDNTAPVVDVTFNNNRVINGTYFDAARTMTVEVVERNFNPNNMDISVTRTNEDGTTSAVSLSGWQHDGNKHWATVDCSKDGIYKVTVSGTDAAGTAAIVNFYGEATDSFVVDTTINEPTISGVENGSAYSGSIVPVVSLTDVNIEDLTVKIYRTRRNEIRVDATDELLGSIQAEVIDGGFEMTLDVFAAEANFDGIYTIVASGKDKAGNTSESEVTFSVNRFGSVYVYDDGLISIMGGAMQSLSEDLVITEYNASGVIAGSARVYITVDGVPVADPIYTITPTMDGNEKPGESGWYEYQYIISKDNFLEDGQYAIVISTEDAAGNLPENTAEDLAIRFAIDTTTPELPSIIGLEEAIYKADSIDVTVSAYDNVQLESIVVYIDGEEVARWDNLEGFQYEGTFPVPSGLNRNIRIVVTDKAGNVLDTDEGNFTPGYAFHDTVTVSTNFFLRFYANTPLFWGTIAGALGIIVIILIFLFLKKRKKEETKTTTA